MSIRTCGARAAVALALVVVPAGSARAARLRFGQGNYTVAPGGSFQVQVYLDMNDAAAGDQMPATGLFSMGVKVVFDPAKLQVESASDITIPAGIDTDGLGGPGIRDVGSGYVRAAGVIPWEATQGYSAPLLVTVTLKALPGVSGSTPLTLGLYRDAPWDNFVDFQGNKLDGQITNFTAATVTVEAVLQPPSIASFWKSGANELTIGFVHPNAAGLTYSVDACWNTTPVGPWIQVPGAVITTAAPGIYQAKVNTATMPGRAFLRISAR